MNAQHPKARYWIRQNIFDSLKSFSEFEARVNALEEEKDRGDVFEIFVEAYLATQAIAQCLQHWVVGKIPLPLRERYRLPNDGTGIDGIYEAHDGSHVAYQVKYRQKRHLTFAEVAPFLGLTEGFTDRVIFTNASSLAPTASLRTRWLSADTFNALTVGALHQMECWLKQKPQPVIRAKPDPRHQTQALADISQTLAENDRATAVMACGTGKTLVAMWAAEQAHPSTVLVLLPSLTLLQQTLREWSEHTNWGARFSYLCVCSDPKVDLESNEVSLDTTDVGFRVDTDPEVVRRFLSRPTGDVKVIFSTYQSSPVVAEGAKGLPPIDFCVLDEAHKTTGRSGTSFSYALSDQNISIRKRLFLTATPRHIDIRHRDKYGEFAVQSMDDPTIYGVRAHTLTFRQAADRGIICPYKVLISLIDKSMVDDFSLKHGVTLVAGDEMAAKWVANLIAVEQATRLVDARKIITFHGRVHRARTFASHSPRGIAHYLNEYRVDHVNGGQDSGVRREIIHTFANADRALITNARCLTEGIDVPAVDMVAFIDPRKSRIDIAQAVGRAMRRPRGSSTKQTGYVLVPLFCGADGADLETTLRSERFDEVASVLNALQENDEELADIIREMRQRRGEALPFDSRRFCEKIQLLGPTVEYERLVESVALEVADRIGASWDECYGRLILYKKANGHCLVPLRYKTSRGYRLGSWSSDQRRRKSFLAEHQIRKLDDLGFVWDPLQQQWEEGFRQLETYKKLEGHCRVPRFHRTEDQFFLGSWVQSQRNALDRMTEGRRQRLDELGFVWDVDDTQWARGLGYLRTFKEREGHCLVSQKFVTDDGFPLGAWVSNQRIRKKRMETSRRQQLDALGFLWDVREFTWQLGLDHLRKFKEREGHCVVPVGYETESSYKLGIWVNNQRGQRKKGLLSEDRIRRLNEVGFVWKVV